MHKLVCNYEALKCVDVYVDVPASIARPCGIEVFRLC